LDVAIRGEVYESEIVWIGLDLRSGRRRFRKYGDGWFNGEGAEWLGR
jgi:hypothetical protein